MYSIELDGDAEFHAELQALLSAIANPLPAYQDIGEYLVDSTKRRFAEGVAPDGTPWAPNRPTTLARKKGDKPLIGESHRLSNEINYQADPAGVDVGSPMIYARVMQEGAEKGEFGTNRRDRPIPWGNIPARPLLGLSESDKGNVLDILREHLQNVGP